MENPREPAGNLESSVNDSTAKSSLEKANGGAAYNNDEHNVGENPLPSTRTDLHISKQNSNSNHKGTQRADILRGWQATCDRQIVMLSLIICGIVIFYVYFGLISPVLGRSRLTNLQIARQDLTKIRNQFKQLSQCYGNLAKNGTAGHDARLFSDKIIPVTRKYINASLADSDLSRKSKALDKLDECMKALTNLHNEFYNWDRASRNLAKVEIKTVNSLPPGFSQFFQSHIERKDNPLYDLEHLSELEAVIVWLQEFEGKDLNSDLCTDARNGLTVDKSGDGGIRLGDTLIRSFPTYRHLEVYTALTKPLKYAPERGLASFNTIQKFCDAPIIIRTIADLDRLDAHLGLTIDRTAADDQPAALNVPVLNVVIGRLFLLITVPLILGALLYLVKFYLQRSQRLLTKMREEPTLGLFGAEFDQNAPYLIPFVLRENPKISAILLRAVVGLMPIAIALTLFYSLSLPWIEPYQVFAILVIGGVGVIFVYKQLKHIHLILQHNLNERWTSK